MELDEEFEEGEPEDQLLQENMWQVVMDAVAATAEEWGWAGDLDLFMDVALRWKSEVPAPEWPGMSIPVYGPYLHKGEAFQAEEMIGSMKVGEIYWLASMGSERSAAVAASNITSASSQLPWKVQTSICGRNVLLRVVSYPASPFEITHPQHGVSA